MAKAVEDDRIANLFTQFRAEASMEILPPGPDAAQQTTRRRRSIRLASVALLTVVGLAGAVAVVAKLAGGTGAPDQPAASPSLRPTLSSDERNRLGVDALAQLGYAPTPDSRRPELLPLRPGVAYGGVDYETQTVSFQGFGTFADTFPPGVYTMNAACAGVGTVAVGWQSPRDLDIPSTSGSLTLNCGASSPGNQIMWTIQADVPGELAITLTPDAEAMGRAGLAVAITDPRIIRARNALYPTGDSTMFGGEGVLGIPATGGVDNSGADVTDFQLSVACAGVGSVHVTFEAGAATSTKNATCTAEAAVTTVTVTSPVVGAAITVRLEPDAIATGQTAVVYWVKKL